MCQEYVKRRRISPPIHWPDPGLDCYANRMDRRRSLISDSVIAVSLIAVGLLAAAACMAQAYRWVDEDGVVHYSDRPDPRAEVIELPEPNTTTVRRYPRASDPSARDDRDTEQAFRYDSLAVASPGSEEHLWNIEGVLTVSLALSPALRPGHQLRVYYDGEAQTVSGVRFQLTNVHRGEHNLQAEVLDERGQLLIRSQPSRFFVHQTSILQPGR